jgi:hypothetical protein
MDPYESPPLNQQAESEFLAASPAPQALNNRLRWWHGLLFAVGVLLAGWCNPNVRTAIDTRQFWPGLLSDLVLVACSGAAIGGMLLAIGQTSQRRRTFPTQLGHWLLLMAGATWLAQVCYSGIEWLVTGTNTVDWQALSKQSANLLAIRALLFLVASLVHWFALRKLRGNLLAQSYVLLLLFVTYWIAFLPLVGKNGAASMMAFSPLGVLLLIVAMLTTLVRDIRHPQGRDQLHWVGWITQVAILIVGMIPVVNVGYQLIRVYCGID